MATVNINSVSKITGEPLKKRGRKSKKEKEQLMQDEMMSLSLHKESSSLDKEESQDNICISVEEKNEHDIYENTFSENEPIENTSAFLIKEEVLQEEQKSGIKKRGRKPKGGKIIQQIVSLNNNNDIKPNVILHLKCSIKDLYKNVSTFSQTVTNSQSFVSYNEYSYETICSLENNTNANVYNTANDNKQNVISGACDEDSNDEHDIICKYNSLDTKDIYKKLKALQHNLHTNNINDKKSACFGARMILTILLFISQSILSRILMRYMVVFAVLNVQPRI